MAKLKITSNNFPQQIYNYQSFKLAKSLKNGVSCNGVYSTPFKSNTSYQRSQEYTPSYFGVITCPASQDPQFVSIFQSPKAVENLNVQLNEFLKTYKFAKLVNNYKEFNKQITLSNLPVNLLSSNISPRFFTSGKTKNKRGSFSPKNERGRIAAKYEALTMLDTQGSSMTTKLQTYRTKLYPEFTFKSNVNQTGKTRVLKSTYHDLLQREKAYISKLNGLTNYPKGSYCPRTNSPHLHTFYYFLVFPEVKNRGPQSMRGKKGYWYEPSVFNRKEGEGMVVKQTLKGLLGQDVPTNERAGVISRAATQVQGPIGMRGNSLGTYYFLQTLLANFLDTQPNLKASLFITPRTRGAAKLPHQEAKYVSIFNNQKKYLVNSDYKTNNLPNNTNFFGGKEKTLKKSFLDILSTKINSISKTQNHQHFLFNKINQKSFLGYWLIPVAGLALLTPKILSNIERSSYGEHPRCEASNKINFVSVFPEENRGPQHVIARHVDVARWVKRGTLVFSFPRGEKPRAPMYENKLAQKYSVTSGQEPLGQTLVSPKVILQLKTGKDSSMFIHTLDKANNNIAYPDPSLLSSTELPAKAASRFPRGKPRAHTNSQIRLGSGLKKNTHSLVIKKSFNNLYSFILSKSNLSQTNKISKWDKHDFQSSICKADAACHSMARINKLNFVHKILDFSFPYFDLPRLVHFNQPETKSNFGQVSFCLFKNDVNQLKSMLYLSTINPLYSNILVNNNINFIMTENLLKLFKTKMLCIKDAPLSFYPHTNSPLLISFPRGKPRAQRAGNKKYEGPCFSFTRGKPRATGSILKLNEFNKDTTEKPFDNYKKALNLITLTIKKDAHIARNKQSPVETTLAFPLIENKNSILLNHFLYNAKGILAKQSLDGEHPQWPSKSWRTFSNKKGLSHSLPTHFKILRTPQEKGSLGETTKQNKLKLQLNLIKTTIHGELINKNNKSARLYYWPTGRLFNGCSKSNTGFVITNQQNITNNLSHQKGMLTSSFKRPFSTGSSTGVCLTTFRPTKVNGQTKLSVFNSRFQEASCSLVNHSILGWRASSMRSIQRTRVSEKFYHINNKAIINLYFNYIKNKLNNFIKNNKIDAPQPESLDIVYKEKLKLSKDHNAAAESSPRFSSGKTETKHSINQFIIDSKTDQTKNKENLFLSHKNKFKIRLSNQYLNTLSLLFKHQKMFKSKTQAMQFINPSALGFPRGKRALPSLTTNQKADLQKKRKAKKQRLETRRQKKRTRFFPRPLWLRYRMFLNFINQRKYSNPRWLCHYPASLNLNYKGLRGQTIRPIGLETLLQAFVKPLESKKNKAKYLEAFEFYVAKTKQHNTYLANPRDEEKLKLSKDQKIKRTKKMNLHDIKIKANYINFKNQKTNNPPNINLKDKDHDTIFRDFWIWAYNNTLTNKFNQNLLSFLPNNTSLVLSGINKTTKQTKNMVAIARINWAVNKTNSSSFTDFSKRYNLWTTQKLRNQSKNNKTKYLEKEFITNWEKFFLNKNLNLFSKKIESKLTQKTQKLNYLTSYKKNLLNNIIPVISFPRGKLFIIPPHLRGAKFKLDKKDFNLKNIKIFNTSWWSNLKIPNLLNNVYLSNKNPSYHTETNIAFRQSIFVFPEENRGPLDTNQRASDYWYIRSSYYPEGAFGQLLPGVIKGETLLIGSSILLHLCALITLVSISQVRCFVKFHLILLYKLSNVYNSLLNQVSKTVAKAKTKPTYNALFLVFPEVKNRGPIRSLGSEHPIKQGFQGPRFFTSGKTKNKALRKNQNKLLTYFSINLLKKQFNTRIKIASFLVFPEVENRGPQNREKKILAGPFITRPSGNKRAQNKMKPIVTMLGNSKGRGHLVISSKAIYSKLNIISLKTVFVKQVKGWFKNKQSLARDCLRKSSSPLGNKKNKGESQGIVELAMKYEGVVSVFPEENRGPLETKLMQIIANNQTKLYLKKTTNSLYKYSKNKLVFPVIFNIIDLFQYSVRNISSFFEKPAEFTTTWIAYGFLVEWSSDFITIIPENIDIYLWNVFSKISRISSNPITLVLNNNPILPFFTQQATVISLTNTASNNKLQFVNYGKNLISCNFPALLTLSHLLHRRILYLFDTLIETISQPDADLISRQEKGTLFWDIWADFLVTAADYYNVNVAALSTIKAEQNTLIDNISNDFENKIARSKKTKSLNYTNLSTGLKTKNIINYKDMRSKIRANALLESNCSLSLLANLNRWSVNQYITYQSWHSHNGSNNSNGDLFIDYHPPKAFSHIPALKYNSILQQPIGSLVCQIYSGIFNKHISKNVLLVNTKTTTKQVLTDYNVLLIQALAGETELKIITDNAQRYAIVNRGFAIGIKLLRDVFDAIALNTPCIFLLEDIHAIGERRPMLISDYGSGMSDDNGSFKEDFFGSQHDEVHEKNQVVYQLTRHAITHYKKPFKGDYSLAIPTNLYVTDLFLKLPTQSTSNLSLVENHNLTIKNKIKKESNVILESQNNFIKTVKNSYLQISKTVKSSANNISNSPFSVLLLKEEKKLKPNKIVEELPWTGLPGEQLAIKPRTSYSVRAKVAMLAELSLSNLSAKLDMITDLLVIIDSVRSNKGFVVFATTDVPHVLDPALRRPGRLDETICLPNVTNSAVLNFNTNYEIIKSVKPTTSYMQQNILNTMLTKNMACNAMLHLRSRCSSPIKVVSNLRENTNYLKTRDAKTQGAYRNICHNYITQRAGNKMDEGLGYWYEDLGAPRKRGALGFPQGKQITGRGIKKANSMLTVNLKDYNTILRSAVKQASMGLSIPKYSEKSSLNYALISHSTNLKSNIIIEKYLSTLKQPLYINSPRPSGSGQLQLVDGPSDFGALGFSPRASHTISPKYEGFEVKRKLKNKAIYGLTTMVSVFPEVENRGQQETTNRENCISSFVTRDLLVKKNKDKAIAYYEVGKVLLNYYLNNTLGNCNYIFGPRFSSGKTNNPSSLGVHQGGKPSEHPYNKNQHNALNQANSFGGDALNLKTINYLSLYGSKNKIIFQLMLIFGGKISQLLSTKTAALGFPRGKLNKIKQQAKNNYAKKLQTTNLLDFDMSQLFDRNENLKIATSIMLSFIHKRYLYRKNLIVPKLLSFTDGNVLEEPPCPPFSSLLIPAKRFENYKRVFRDSIVGDKMGQRKAQINLTEKLQYHTQLRSIKLLNNKLLNNKLLNTGLEANFIKNIGSLTTVTSNNLLQNTTNMNWYYQNRILKRHGQYLTNQWWNGQLSEHNAETVFLSDIDWRSSFIKNKHINVTKTKNIYSLSKQKKSSDILDVLLDFPDTEQYYNPRRRRWLLNKGPRNYTSKAPREQGALGFPRGGKPRAPLAGNTRVISGGAWDFWFNFDKVYSEEIVTTWILESIIQTYMYLHNNTELLDFVTNKFIVLGYPSTEILETIPSMGKAPSINNNLAAYSKTELTSVKEIILTNSFKRF